MKKSVAVLAALLAAVFMLAGCTGTPAADNKAPAAMKCMCKCPKCGAACECKGMDMKKGTCKCPKCGAEIKCACCASNAACMVTPEKAPVAAPAKPAAKAAPGKKTEAPAKK